MAILSKKGFESNVVAVSPRRELNEGIYRAIYQWNMAFFEAMNGRGFGVAIPELHILSADSSGSLEGNLESLWREDNLYAVLPEDSLRRGDSERGKYFKTKISLIKNFYGEKKVPYIMMGGYAEKEIESWRMSGTPFAVHEEEFRRMEKYIPEGELLYEKFDSSVENILKSLNRISGATEKV